MSQRDTRDNLVSWLDRLADGISVASGSGEDRHRGMVLTLLFEKLGENEAKLVFGAFGMTLMILVWIAYPFVPIQVILGALQLFFSLVVVLFIFVLLLLFLIDRKFFLYRKLISHEFLVAALLVLGLLSLVFLILIFFAVKCLMEVVILTISLREYIDGFMNESSKDGLAWLIEHDLAAQMKEAILSRQDDLMEYASNYVPSSLLNTTMHNMQEFLNNNTSTLGMSPSASYPFGAFFTELWADIRIMNFTAVSEKVVVVHDGIQGTENLPSNIMSGLDIVSSLLTSASAFVGGLILLLFNKGFYASMAVIDTFFGVFVFVFSLFYLLKSNDSFLELIMLFVLKEDDQLRKTIHVAFSTGMESIFVCTVKVWGAHVCLTLMAHFILDAPGAYLSAFLSGFFGVVPIIPTYLTVLPFAIVLLAKSQWISAIGLVASQFVLMFYVDPFIYAHIHNSLPFITGLSIILGYYAFSLQGVLLGPALVCFTVTIYYVFVSTSNEVGERDDVLLKEFDMGSIYRPSSRSPVTSLNRGDQDILDLGMLGSPVVSDEEGMELGGSSQSRHVRLLDGAVPMESSPQWPRSQHVHSER